MKSVPASQNIPHLIDQLRSLNGGVVKDECLRKELYETINELSLSIESPRESVLRIMYSPLQITLARIASDLNLFEILDRKGPTSAIELVKETKADLVLLRRILRSLASLGMVEETAEDQYGPNTISRAFEYPGFKAGLYHNFDSISPALFSLPKFLANTEYQNPTDNANSAFQLAHNTKLSAFDYALTPESGNMLRYMGPWMKHSHDGLPIWLDVFPFEDYSQNIVPKTPLFVDVGGGVGHQCISLRAKFPHLPGRIILQDQAMVVQQAPATEGVETMAHDFWTEQPIKDARLYYFRNILHDYPDDMCIKLLKLTISALGKESIILIDDIVLPNRKIHWQSTQLDFTMMACLSAMERTENEWHALLDAVGLKITNIYKYAEDPGDSIIVAVPAQRG